PRSSATLAAFLFLILVSCGESQKKGPDKVGKKIIARDTLPPSVEGDSFPEEIEVEEEPFVLTEENAIDFFFRYAKELKGNRVRVNTSMGSFTLRLYDNVPYHKANFIYLAEKNYFDSTQFHRVVKDFIIQGGSTDNPKVMKKRRAIGRYLLPPDTRKGHSHHRGTISMPSSVRDNPHKLASPYEFFIVVTSPGSYHLDGSYTPFGRVVEGMEVVDAINSVPVGDGDWPWESVYILNVELL